MAEKGPKNFSRFMRHGTRGDQVENGLKRQPGIKWQKKGRKIFRALCAIFLLLIRIQSHKRLQTVFSIGQLDHHIMTRNTIFIFRWQMESRNNNNNELKLRLLDQKRTLLNRQVEYSPNPQHRNSSQHFEYFGNRRVRESRNEQKRTSRQFPSDLKRKSIIEELIVLQSTKNWFSAQLNKESTCTALKSTRILVQYGFMNQLEVIYSKTHVPIHPCLTIKQTILNV